MGETARWAASWAEVSQRVGPHGYIHGWIFVGAPGVGEHVFHPHHGHGTVSAVGGSHATVKFHSGAEHSFEVRPGSGPAKLEPRSGPESPVPEWQRIMEEQAAKSTAAAESNAAAMTGMMQKHREGQQRLMKALGFVAPHVADMKLMHTAGEYKSAVDLLHEGKYAAAVAMLDKAAGIERDRRNPGAAARLAKLSAKVAKAAAKLGQPATRAAEMLTHPGGTERLHQYWVHGEGAAKIRWGAPGDFDRCVMHLGKFIKDPQGYCNLAHHAALGIYPATHAAMEHGRAAMADSSKRPYGDVTYADPKNGKYPIDTEEHARAAWSYINQAKNAAMYPMNGVTLSEVKDRIMAACKKFGIDVSGDSGRAEAPESPPAPFTRSYPLEDISIRAGGDGRTVDAYAAVFETPVPIRDQDGDYIEVIDPAAFNRILPKLAPQGQRANWRVGVFYNHGMTIHATPSERGSMPIGIPLEIKVDQRGLFTRTRYHKGELADQVLEAIREGSLSGYSFSGRFDRSTPPKPRGGWRPDRAGLPVVRRTESTLREYGPTPFPAYADAGVTAVRADLVTEQLDQITEALRSGVPLDSLPELTGAPHEEDSPAEDSRPLVRSGRSLKQEMQAERSAFLQRYRR